MKLNTFSTVGVNTVSSVKETAVTTFNVRQRDDDLRAERKAYAFLRTLDKYVVLGGYNVRFYVTHILAPETATVNFKVEHYITHDTTYFDITELRELSTTSMHVAELPKSRLIADVLALSDNALELLFLLHELERASICEIEAKFHDASLSAEKLSEVLTVFSTLELVNEDDDKYYLTPNAVSTVQKLMEFIRE